MNYLHLSRVRKVILTQVYSYKIIGRNALVVVR